MVELLVVIAIVSIGASLAGPSMQDLFLHNRITNHTNILSKALQITRSSAVSYASVGTICASSNQTSCNTADWTQGWIIFADINGDGAPTTSLDVDGDGTVDGTEIVSVMAALPNNIQITAVSGFGQVNYAALGMQNLPATALTFNVCDSTRTGELGRQIQLSVSGRVQINDSFECS